MTKIFYDQLINIEEVIVELDQHEISVEERSEFISLIDETLHHHILNVILSSLPSEKQNAFLDRFNKAPFNPELLAFIEQITGVDIEAKIKAEAAKVKKEILAEIKKAKKR